MMYTKKIALIFLLLLLTSVVSAENLINTTAPNFFSKNLNSPQKEFVKLDDEIAKENGVIIAFFASWCSPCKKELPFLQSLTKELGVSLIAISVDDKWGDNENKMVVDMNFTAPVLHDKYKIISKQYDYSGQLPYSIYINKNGVIKHISSQYSPEMNNEIREKIKNLK